MTTSREPAAADRPAILGGEPAVRLAQDEAMRWPIVGPADEAAVLRVLRDGNLTTHPVIRELEEAYRDLTGRRFALSHCNGTAGLLAAFFSLDLEPGDEILVPSATWWASVLPMLWFGLVPVFCESEGERLGLDPEDAERRITDRTRAMVVVHLWGLPSKMSELFSLASRHGLKIIEDASHAQGATWRDRPCGSLGDVSVISLQGEKLAPAGEGGVFLTDDQDAYERAVCLGDITRIWELQSDNRRFGMTSFGFKTRIAPMSAALGCSQLQALPERNKRREHNVRYLSRALEELGCFETYLGPPHVHRTYFECVVRYDDASGGLPIELLCEALVAEGCRVAAPRYPLLHEQPFFTEGHWRSVLRLPPAMGQPEAVRDPLPVTTRSVREMLRLPTFPNADEELLDQYAEAFQKVTRNAEAIRAARAAQG